MPYIQGLNSYTQDIIMLNFEFFAKKLFLGACFLFFFYYIFIYWKNKQDSPYILMGVIRLIIYCAGIVFIVALPLMMFILYPQVPLDTLLMWMLLFYSIMSFVVGAVFFLNILYFGIGTVAKFAGFSPDGSVDEVINKNTKSMFKLLVGKKRWND